MKNNRWKKYALWILGTEAVGAVSGLLNRNGMKRYAEEIAKPRFSPPELLFPIAWSILYALMGIGAARIAEKPDSRERTVSLGLFGIQLAFNFIWSFLFFGAQAFGFAFVWLAALLILVLWMTIWFSRLDHPAAWLQLPYLLWLVFAGYLNYGVWMLNR